MVRYYMIVRYNISDDGHVVSLNGIVLTYHVQKFRSVMVRIICSNGNQYIEPLLQLIGEYILKRSGTDTLLLTKYTTNSTTIVSIKISFIFLFLHPPKCSLITYTQFIEQTTTQDSSGDLKNILYERKLR